MLKQSGPLARRLLGQRLKTIAEWAGLAALGILFGAAYPTIGWYLAGFADALGVPSMWQEIGLIVWVAAGLTALVLWLGWYTGTLTIRRRLAQVDAPTVEWDLSELTALVPVSGDLRYDRGVQR